MEVTVQLSSTDKQLELFGPADSYLRILRQSLDVQISARQGRLLIKGKEKDVNKAAEVVDKMQDAGAKCFHVIPPSFESW